MLGLMPRHGSNPVSDVVRPLAVLATCFTLCACAEGPDRNAPVSADRGAELLREIRSDPARARELTPAERQYLNKALRR